MSTKLNQVIAVEKGIKSKVTADIDVIYKAVQKPALFEGFVKTYKKRNEEEEDQPTQRQKVQASVGNALTDVSNRLTALFDVTAQKDFANCNAKADVVVDGETLLTGAPATYLLFLEKQLTDLSTFVEKLPVLDAAEEWTLDPNESLYRTAPALTNRTKKVQKPLVLYPATAEHPAQTQLITEDVVAGTWEQIRFSGAMPFTAKKALVLRVLKLGQAVKQAREAANLADAPEQNVGAKILGWIFGKA